VNRTQYRQIAEDRIVDAEILLRNHRWSAAYYLAGYAVECGLKACIAKLTNQDDFPRDRKFVEQCYTHSVEKLLKAAGLKPELDDDADKNIAFSSNWGLVKDWEEISRYEQKTQADAEELYLAITHNPDGVMPWIRLHW
jgi:HEPN domain-containing protein